MNLFDVTEETSKVFYFNFQNSNVLDISQFQWLISTEGKITQNV
jgi:hypothetical protein